MIDLQCDIWEAYDNGHVICITTNGFIKKNGLAVCGRGVAKQAADHFPNFRTVLGRDIKQYGNIVMTLYPRVVAFPVKPESGISTVSNVVPHLRHHYVKGQKTPGWALMAYPTLIQRSLIQLKSLRDINEWKLVFLPRPGCGAGGLDWEKLVRGLCAEYGDWLIVVHKEDAK